MPNLIKEIKDATKDNHEALHNDPFIARYKDDVTVEDHYQHLAQLSRIYTALEAGLGENPLLESLPEELALLRSRSAAIQQDMDWIKATYADIKEPCPVAATTKYIDELKNLTYAKDHEALLGHYLTRILGDMLGGQKIKGRLVGLYSKDIELNAENASGRAFYTFPEGASKTFFKWLNVLDLSDEATNKITQAANTAMKGHLSMYHDLEAARANGYKPRSYASSLLGSISNGVSLPDMPAMPQWANNACTFFNNNQRNIALGAAAATVAVGAVVAARRFKN